MSAMAWIGSDHVRHDGTEKVRGEPIYGADRTAEAMTYAVPVSATVGRGRITALDTTAAQRVPGVLAVLTHENLDRLHPADFAYGVGERERELPADAGRRRGLPGSTDRACRG